MDLAAVQLWSDRKLRRYVRIARRIWPHDARVIAAITEQERRATLKKRAH